MLSLTDPRDKIVLWTELEDLCDKPSSVGARRYYQLDGPVYHVLSVLHISEAKLIALSTNDMPWRNFRSPEFRKKFQREVPLFLKVPEFPYKRLCRKKHPCQEQIKPSIPFDRTPTCNRQTAKDRHRHGHRAIASTRASITSRG